jgi:hypothetical protein
MQINAEVPAEMVSVIQGLIVLFVAAPRVIDWMAKRGVDYGLLIKRAPIMGIGDLVTTLWTVSSGVLALMLVSNFSRATPFAVILLVAAMAIGFYAFAKMLAKNAIGPFLAVFAAMEWLLLVLMAVVVGSQLMLFPSFVTALTGLAGPLMILYSARRKERTGGN